MEKRTLDELEKIIKQGFQIHIKNTVEMNWFAHFERRVCDRHGITTTMIYLDTEGEDQFHDTIELAVKQGIRLINEGKYIRIGA